MTCDAFFNGRLKITQMRHGYRFSIDAVLLAAEVRPKTGQSIVDLGTGCGIIPLILAYRFPTIRVWSVELQSELAELARYNTRDNQLENRICVIEDDIRRLTQNNFGGPVDWVIANPPYRGSGSGRVNPSSQKASARHEIHLNLSELIHSASRLLRTGGWLAVIYPAERLVDVLTQMRARRIEPKWLRTVQSHCREPARLIMVQGVMGGRPGMVVREPIVIYEPDGGYTETVQAMMTP